MSLEWTVEPRTIAVSIDGLREGLNLRFPQYDVVVGGTHQH
jgi:hypothetical protein